MSLPFEDQDETTDKSAGTVIAEPTNETPTDTPDFPTLAGRAQAFLNEGRFDAAREVFIEIIGVLEDKPSYQRAVALERVGFCSLMEGQPLAAAGFLQQSPILWKHLIRQRAPERFRVSYNQSWARCSV